MAEPLAGREGIWMDWSGLRILPWWLSECVYGVVKRITEK